MRQLEQGRYSHSVYESSAMMHLKLPDPAGNKSQQIKTWEGEHILYQRQLFTKTKIGATSFYHYLIFVAHACLKFSNFISMC